MATTSNLRDTGTRRLVLLSIASLGVGAVVTQLALLREMLSVFEGNEMVLGILLGNWLLLTGTGAWIGRIARQAQNPLRLLVPSQLLIAVLPLLQVVALRVLRNVAFTRGAMVGPFETVFASLIILAPFCLTSGFMLTLACSILARRRENDDLISSVMSDKKPHHDEALEIGCIYIADSLGSIAGGLLFSFCLVLVLDHFGALCVPAALNLAMAAVMAWRWQAQKFAFVALVLLAGLAFTRHIDEMTTQLQHGAVPVLFRSNSPYGRLVVTESSRQFNFNENGVPLFSTHNTEQIEETVHYAMAQRPDARRVLLIGGGASGTAREILKYDTVEQVTYIELDPLIIIAARRFAPESLADPRIRTSNTDGRLFVRQTTEQFDVVIVDVPEPATMQLNRFYTAEFYSELKRVLRNDGVVSFALSRYENYVSRELARLLGSAQRTLRQSFRHTLLLPGGRVFVLASNGELTTDIAARVATRGVKVQLMTRNYLDAMLTTDRLSALQLAPDKKSSPNEDFSPVLYYYHLRYWLSRNPTRTGLLIGFMLTVLLACPFLLRGGAIVVFAGGFAASALEVTLLLAFQILCGSVYHQVGIVVTVFMAGLTAGAWLANRPKKLSRRASLSVLATAIALFAAMLPFALVQLSAMSFDAVRVVVPALTFGIAVLVGMEFPVASQAERTDPTTTAAVLYAADFAGAALGALLASTLLIPVLGVAATCWLTGGLNLAAAGLVWLRRKRR